MKIFRCQCGAQIFFDNTQCLSCGRGLGFLPDVLAMHAFALDESSAIERADSQYRKCKNYALHGVCNWLLPNSVAGDLCQACQLNNVIPDLSQPANCALWLEVEKAKRRLVYSLNRLQLQVVSKYEDPAAGLSFDIKADVGDRHVLTGHSDGLITLNLGEADAIQREQMREAMKERYRTLLGHFRHEIGHYYWDRLVRDKPQQAEFRELFGDERTDYSEALQRHYASSPAPDYAEYFISHYATAHPWEDFAETFSHYLHMVDTLETAQQFGFVSSRIVNVAAFEFIDFVPLMAEWQDLTVALNSLNRSMGLPDVYPFAISPKVHEKIEFVHQLILQRPS